MRIGIEAREWNGMYQVAEADGIQLGRNGGCHDVEGIEERQCSVEEG